MTARSVSDERDFRTFWILVGIAVVGALGAGLAGILLAAIDPADGSTTEGSLGLTAAIGGLAAGVSLAAAAIYAQMKNLWRFAPLWFRHVAWAAMIVVAVAGLVALR